MRLEVEYTINEGLSFWDGNYGILLDYLFDNKVTAWSDMPDLCLHRMVTKTREFGRSHMLLFSHAHCDHYSAKYVRKYMEDYDAEIYGVGVPESNLPILSMGRGVGILEYAGYRIVLIRTKHQGTGAQAKIRNAMVCIGSGRDWYVQLGDSILSEETLELMAEYGVEPPRAVFCNLYQIVPQGQRKLIQQMNAEKVFCIHFPFRQNDEYGIYRQIIHFKEKAADPFLKRVIVPDPMSRLL